MYPEPHDHRRYGRGHVERVRVTTGAALALIRRYAPSPQRVTVADLSCGDEAIIGGIRKERAVQRSYTGDLAPGREFEGPIERTISEVPSVNLFVCAETLEHLDDPDSVLAQIREKAQLFVCSTPVGAWDDANAQHLWAWSVAEVSQMLESAGWRIVQYCEVDSTLYGESYIYGIWGCI